MHTEMLGPGASPASDARAPLQRVRDAISALGCSRAWARGAGHHVLVVLGDEAFARLTPLGGGAFGLAFRSRTLQSWEPMLLVDELCDVVEHALVAVDALRI